MDDVPLLSQVEYGSLSVGDAWGPLTETLEPETGDALGDGVLPLLTLRVLRRALGGILPGGVLVRQHFEVRATLTPGDVVIDVRVTGQQHPRSGLYTTFTFALEQDGTLAAVVDWMILAP